MAKELHENKDTEERLILVGIELEDKDSPSAMAVEACLDELEELVNTAGATAVARTIPRTVLPLWQWKLVWMSWKNW